MINVDKLFTILNKQNIDFYCGVPDSLLKDFCAFLKDNVSEENNIIAANEGNAIGIASGYHLATNKIPLVYMQNSGLGNTVNPIASLQDKLVYSIPTLLFIGWRGEPGVKDEPQHVKQGMITLQLLETMGIKYQVIDKNTTNKDIDLIIKKSVKYMTEENEPYAIVIKKGTFEEYKLQNVKEKDYELTREYAIEIITRNLEKEAIIVSTTGMASRELFEIREKYNESHNKDFLTVGSMGHASQIALGISIANNKLPVYCLDGDGAILMHLGGLSITGSLKPEKYKHILINNGAHDSVGGQDTVGYNIDFEGLSKSVGYEDAIICDNIENLLEGINKLKNISGPALLEVRVRKGGRKDLGRPTVTPLENKKEFMKNLIGGSNGGY